MKLAIIDHLGNPGGGSRYLRALVPQFVRLRPELQITFFGSSEAIEREGLKDEWAPLGIEIKPLTSRWLASKNILGIKGSQFLIRLMHERYASFLSRLPYVLSGAVHEELEKKIKGFDLAFFPWPYFLSCPKLPCPIAAVFHDFNFRYQFSGLGFSRDNFETLSSQIPLWLERSQPIVSTHFIASELKKFYPQHGNKTKVIHLAPMSALSQMTRIEAETIIKRFRLPKAYILYPTNISPHKNINSLLSAFFLLRKRKIDASLVLVGYGTENLNGKSWEFGLIKDAPNPDVFGLGYVSNQEIDALIQCASVVVSTSLYEAGNGPGLDSWGKGVPVAMSKIPSFLEHLDVQKVRAKVFDPTSPSEIAAALEEILKNPEKAAADAQASQQAIESWSWEKTAQNYLQVFDEALHATP